jgi:hypothetical protein
VSEDGTRFYSSLQLSEIFGGPGVATPPPQHTITTSDSEPLQSCCSEISADSSDCNQDSAQTEGVVESAPWDAAPTYSQQTAAETAGLDTEVQRLTNLLSMQERILDAKDDEIADLRSQRTWLRERIEKLEEKSDRDQILLLSETQTIRKLISYQESRKTVVQLFLEWIGVSQSKELTTMPSSSEFGANKVKTANGRTIEVPAAANDQ